MNRQPVQSSLLRSVGYNALTQILEVETTKDTVYQYRDVPEFVYRGLILSKSVGSYFTKTVVDRYPCEEVTTRSVVGWKTE